jgi:y4mF family transcriptional regulator
MKANNYTSIALFVKKKRKETKLTQVELATKAGVGLNFVRDLEQNKKTLRIDKVNDVLILFGHELAPTPIDREKLINK